MVNSVGTCDVDPSTETGDAVILKMRDESIGFGSRTAGRQLRNKCVNLLNAEPTKPLFLDWTGVPLVSSGFADELVGKLFVRHGPLAFSARVRNHGMEAVVGSIVDKAILQGAAQVANSHPQGSLRNGKRFVRELPATRLKRAAINGVRAGLRLNSRRGTQSHQPRRSNRAGSPFG